MELSLDGTFQLVLCGWIDGDGNDDDDEGEVKFWMRGLVQYAEDRTGVEGALLVGSFEERFYVDAEFEAGSPYDNSWSPPADIIKLKMPVVIRVDG